MNETLNTIYSRRAVRKYKDIPVSKKLIEQILDAGRMAPSAINKQPWKFYIISEKEQINILSGQIKKAAAKAILKSGVKRIFRAAKDYLHFSPKIDFLTEEDSIFHGAPLVIFITAPVNNEWAQLDIGMCSQNMMLAAKSLGIDSCPIGLGKFVEKTKAYPTLKIPSSDRVLISLIFGYGNENPAVHERIKNNAVFL